MVILNEIWHKGHFGGIGAFARADAQASFLKKADSSNLIPGFILVLMDYINTFDVIKKEFK